MELSFWIHLLSLIIGVQRMARASTFNISNTSDMMVTLLKSKNMNQVLRDVISGPLRGHHVTLVVQEELGKISFSADHVLGNLDTPVNILLLPQEKPTTSVIESRANYYTSTGVMIVLVNDDDHWWPLWRPVESWRPYALMIISTLSDCWTKSFLKAPLIQQTSYASLICPEGQKRGMDSALLSLKAWTWAPFSHSHSKLIRLGVWDAKAFSLWSDLFVDRFRDMSEKRMTILANGIDRPFFYTRANGEPAGQTFQIVFALSKWLNYSYNITSGASVNYTIMTELVQKGENDLMFNYATPTMERFRDFQLTVPYAYEGFGIMLGVPPPLPSWQNLLYPFSWQVWASTLLSLVLSSFTFHSLHRGIEKSFINNAIIVSQSLLSNPLEAVPSGWRTRNFLLVWWLVSWILSVSYTCNLIAILTVPVFSKKIQTTEELAQSHYRLCMLDYGEFVQEALATSTQPTYFALGAKMDMVPIVHHLPEMGEEACVELVQAGSHAHTEAYPYAAALYSMMGLNPKVYAMRERLYPGYLVILIYKRAPWKFKFDIGMERLREAGLMQRWYQESMAEFGVKVGAGGTSESSSTSVLEPLSLGHLQGSFLFLLLGFITGVLSMVGEILFPPKRQKGFTTRGTT